ncbi:MAG: hypothetical protein JSS32_10205 [Verrucomicrobia bacterium]|nr:hypothetical protein [Verrucomicrobiota bacterium]
MDTNRWTAPFAGLIYFLTHPRMWLLPLLGIVASAALTLFAVLQTIYWKAPFSDAHSLAFVWQIFQMLGWGCLTFVFMLLFVWPLILNFCFLKVFNSQLRREGIFAKADMGIVSSIGVFFRTMKWRIIWPFLICITIFFLPFFTIPLTVLAVNHLAVLEAADVALSAYGKSGRERAEWIQRHGTDCMALALSGAGLNVLLSLTVVGWILWIPAVFCGTFLYMKSFNYDR